jgi:hypothetical protein
MTCDAESVKIITESIENIFLGIAFFVFMIAGMFQMQLYLDELVELREKAEALRDKTI